MAKNNTTKKKKINADGSMGSPIARLFHGQVVSVDFFARHWLPVLLTVGFILVYISSRYICQSRMEEIARLNKELEIVKAERVRVRSLYMGRTSESAMQQLVDSMHLGLNVQEQPPYKLPKK